MATGQYIGINGVARKVVSPYIGVEGVARNVKSGYVGVDGVARLFFTPEGGSVVLEVEKITSDTYANETTYTAEEFILLDIYPKTGGTVNVTYGGLTKTITDTSGAEEPNAQKVFFGTFNGVADEVEIPASGELTIEGSCRGFGCGSYAKSSKGFTSYCSCITEVMDFGSVRYIPYSAFAYCADLTNIKIPPHSKLAGGRNFIGCTGLTNVEISNGITNLPSYMLSGCTGLTSVIIPASVKSMGTYMFENTNINNPITIDSENTAYKIDGNCLVEISSNTLLSGFLDSVIPSYITTIAASAFAGLIGLTSITIPDSVSAINYTAFNSCTDLTNATILATTPPTVNLPFLGCSALASIVVPTGCGEAYKAAEGWSEYADYIVEAT